MEKKGALSPEAFFSAAVLSNPDVISISSLEDGRFLEVNEAFLDLTGYCREETIGKTANELGIWSDEGDRESFLRLLAQSGRVKDLDVRIGMKGGERRLVQMSAAIVQIGSRDCITATCRDVTDQRLMAERLAKDRFLLERAEEMADIGSWEFDYAAGKVDASPGAFRVYGVEAGEFTVKAIEAVPLQEYRPLLDAARTALIENGTPYDVEFKIERKNDGAVRDIHSKASWDPVNKRLFGIIRDVTEARAAAERLRRALAEKETLIRELYHRTKNNMQVVSSLLGMEASRSERPELAEILDEVQRRIDSMALVHEMLYRANDLSRINLKDFVPALAELLKASLGDHEGRVRFAFDVRDVDILMEAAVPCGLILNELMTNSLIHGFPGARSGTIRLCARREAEGSVHIEISDDGVGASAGVEKAEGTKHLGLSLVSSIGRFQLGGTVEFQPGPPGFGCVLRFRDGLSEAAGDGREAGPASRPGDGKP